ncbi:MAG: imidazole glycerol phosphate synthase subunit HisF [Candidatus Bipolaricaulia bacterium]
MALAKRIIPCLDVWERQVVKGIQFKQLRQVGDPAVLAAAYEEQGADEIVFLDIAASKQGQETIYQVIQQTAENLFIPLTVGGGIQRLTDIRRALNAGAEKISINTAAVENPGLIEDGAGRFGNQCVVVAIDAKQEGNGWTVYTHGGSQNRGFDAIEWAREVERLGAGEILLTSMDADGTRAGYDVSLTRAVCEATNIPVIASGGCGEIEHIYQVFDQTGADAALAASIFHYGRYTVAEVKSALNERGVPIRL